MYGLARNLSSPRVYGKPARRFAVSEYMTSDWIVGDGAAAVNGRAGQDDAADFGGYRDFESPGSSSWAARVFFKRLTNEIRMSDGNRRLH
jgi:hypothetical protein